MRMGGLTKLGTLGRGPMKQLTTCLSVFVLEMAKGSGLANLWVSKPPTVQTQGGYVTCLLFLGQLFRCIFYCSDGWILSHHHRLINLTQQNSSTTTCLS